MVFFLVRRCLRSLATIMAILSFEVAARRLAEEEGTCAKIEPISQILQPESFPFGTTTVFLDFLQHY